MTSLFPSTAFVKVVVSLTPGAEQIHEDYQVNSSTTSRQLISWVLRKHSLVSRDTNLFYLTREPGAASKIEENTRRNSIIIDSEDRVLLLHEANPNGRFTMHMRTGGLIKIYDSCLSPGSHYKSLFISSKTTSREVIALVLGSHQLTDSPDNFRLVEQTSKGKEISTVKSDDYPLEIQRLRKNSEIHLKRVSEKLKKRVVRAQSFSTSQDINEKVPSTTREATIARLRESFRWLKRMRSGSISSQDSHMGAEQSGQQSTEIQDQGSELEALEVKKTCDSSAEDSSVKVTPDTNEIKDDDLPSWSMLNEAFDKFTTKVATLTGRSLSMLSDDETINYPDDLPKETQSAMSTPHTPHRNRPIANVRSRRPRDDDDNLSISTVHFPLERVTPKHAQETEISEKYVIQSGTHPVQSTPETFNNQANNSTKRFEPQELTRSQTLESDLLGKGRRRMLPQIPKAQSLDVEHHRKVLETEAQRRLRQLVSGHRQLHSASILFPESSHAMLTQVPSPARSYNGRRTTPDYDERQKENPVLQQSGRGGDSGQKLEMNLSDYHRRPVGSATTNDVQGNPFHEFSEDTTLFASNLQGLEEGHTIFQEVQSFVNDTESGKPPTSDDDYSDEDVNDDPYHGHQRTSSTSSGFSWATSAETVADATNYPSFGVAKRTASRSSSQDPHTSNPSQLDVDQNDYILPFSMSFPASLLPRAHRSSQTKEGTVQPVAQKRRNQGHPSLFEVAELCHFFTVKLTRQSKWDYLGINCFESVFPREMAGESIVHHQQLSPSGRKPVLGKRPGCAFEVVSPESNQYTESVICVDNVADDSLASMEGSLQPGDIIVEVNGVCVLPYSPDQVELLLHSYTHIQIMIARFKHSEGNGFGAMEEEDQSYKSTEYSTIETTQLREKYERMKLKCNNNEQLIRELRSMLSQKVQVRRITQGNPVLSKYAKRNVFRAIKPSDVIYDSLND